MKTKDLNDGQNVGALQLKPGHFLFCFPRLILFFPAQLSISHQHPPLSVLQHLAGAANPPPTRCRRPPSQHAAGHLPRPS